MDKLVECVPNISEGRNRKVIEDIAGAARIEGVEVLDVDPGKATNRTVITLAGSPDAAVEAAFNLIRKASELIDMRKHKGEHPRIGAADVVPFVPLQGVTLQECAALARKLGARVAKELNIPVYLYEAAAAVPERQSLAYCREGEYEGLARKLKQPKWKPDFGKAQFNPKSGLTVIGARPFLIAYNVNLNTRDKKLATKIAQRIRESGYNRKNDDGSSAFVPGMFNHCRAVGWFIEEYGIAQVSINLTDFEITGLHDVFDACSELAGEMGLRVTGSEIVGLVPKAALLASGRHYLKKQGASQGVSEERLIETALKSLGLSDVSPFDARTRIIEERIVNKSGLVDLKVSAFIDAVASDSPAPGGGSVAALAGALSAGLASMVAALSFVKEKDGAGKRKTLESAGMRAQALKSALVALVDEDTRAFDKVMAAFRMKTSTPAEEKQKAGTIIEAYKLAAGVPFEVAQKCLEALSLAGEVLNHGIDSAYSDSSVAARMAYAGFLGASYNVRINLKELRKLACGNKAELNFARGLAAKLKNLSSQAARLNNAANKKISAKLG